MFKSGQKIFGYVLEQDKWIEYNSWDIMAYNEVDYRIWHDKNDKLIHVNRNLNSPLIYFNRGHRTFSYFSKNDGAINGNSGPISISHVLRQKVIADKLGANFLISKEKINKNDKKKYDYNITFKNILVEPEIKLLDGRIRRPDIFIEFDEPAELALKWNNKLVIEVVEENETSGEKIEAYQDLGFGVLEIPQSYHFNDLKGKKFSDIRKENALELEKKIINFFNKSIWADLIVDPSSKEFLKQKSESEIFQKNQNLKLEIKKLTAENQDFSEIIEKQLLKISQLQNKVNELDYNFNKVKNNSIEKENTISALKIKITKWNDAPLLKKLTTGFKIK